MNILVYGLGKSGTTVVSKTIHNSLPDAQYHLEPKHLRYFDANVDFSKSNVVKILCPTGFSFPDTLRLAGRFDKSIGLVRDPRDRMISAMFHSAGSLLRKGTDEQKSLLAPFLDAVKEKEHEPSRRSFIELLDLVLRAATRGPDSSRVLAHSVWPIQKVSDFTVRHGFFCLRYEDFIQGKHAELERYLGFPLTGEQDAGEWSWTKRSGGFNNWKRFFTPSDVEHIKSTLGEQIEALGYTDWTLEPCESLDPKEGSDYLASFVNSPRAKQGGGNRPRDGERPQRRAGAKSRRRTEATGAARGRRDVTGAPRDRGQRPAAKQVRGRLVRVLPNMVVGWAAPDASGDPATVTLKVNGVERGSVVAGELRKSLAKRGRHGDGRHGFTFRLEPDQPLAIGDQLSVVFQQDGHALRSLVVSEFGRCVRRKNEGSKAARAGNA